MAEHSYLKDLISGFRSRSVDRREFLRTATLLGMSATAAYAIAGVPDMAALAQEATAAPDLPKGGEIKIAMPVHGIELVHGMNWGEAANMLRGSLEYLTRTGADNITRPFLLESWEPSEDLKTWTLKLRRDVTWAKGGPLTADHVVWNFKSVLDPKTGSSVAGLMKDYMLTEFDSGEKDDKGNPRMSSRLWDDKAIEKVDDYTIKLNLKQPQLAVPEHLFHFPFMIVHPDEPTLAVGMNGTGAFNVSAYEPSRRIRLEARKDYWRTGYPFLDAIEFIDYGGDASAPLAAFLSNQVDALYDVGEDEAKAIRPNEQLKVYQAVSAETIVARMRCDTKPFDDARVRKAMRLASDPVAAMQAGVLGNGELAENHHVCFVHPEYAKLAPMPRDIEKAKALLAEAGYPDGLDVEFTVKSTPAKESRAAQVLAQSWSEAGIRATINIVPEANYWDVWTEVPLGFTSWSHRPLAIMVLGLAYRSGVPWNESHFANKEFDALLAQAEATPDVEKRREVMARIETLMQEEGPVVQPFWVNQLAAYHARIQNVNMHPSRYIFAEELAVSA